MTRDDRLFWVRFCIAALAASVGICGVATANGVSIGRVVLGGISGGWVAVVLWMLSWRWRDRDFEGRVELRRRLHRGPYREPGEVVHAEPCRVCGKLNRGCRELRHGAICVTNHVEVRES